MLFDKDVRLLIREWLLSFLKAQNVRNYVTQVYIKHHKMYVIYLQILFLMVFYIHKTSQNVRNLDFV